MEVQEYLKEDGVSPYQEWFETLDPIAAAKMALTRDFKETVYSWL